MKKRTKDKVLKEIGNLAVDTGVSFVKVLGLIFLLTILGTAIFIWVPSEIAGEVLAGLFLAFVVFLIIYFLFEILKLLFSLFKEV